MQRRRLPASDQLRIMHRRMRPFAAAVFAAASLLSAQEPQPQKPAAGHVLVDTVVATVNDASIMLSELRTRAVGKVNNAERQIGRRLTEAEIGVLFQDELKPLIDKHAMAQAAKTFGIATPEQVEQYFRDEMKLEEADQVRDLGTHQEFSRELQRQGLTWPTYYREQRVEKMYRLAIEFAVSMRMQKQSNLFLTPSMLRKTWREHVGLFVHGAAANILVITFTGPDARGHAEQAAGLWEKANMTPAELLAAIPLCKANVIPFANLADQSRESHPPQLVDFALAGPEGRVSQPMALGDGIVVAKVIAHRPARNGKFEDAQVQGELRVFAENKVRAEFLGQALRRALDRTEYWVTPTLR